jgi:hypothetical protein
LALPDQGHHLFAPQEKGQGFIEYAIILSLVALIVIAVMWRLGPQVGDSSAVLTVSYRNLLQVWRDGNQKRLSKESLFCLASVCHPDGWGCPQIVPAIGCGLWDCAGRPLLEPPIIV